ncbi:unnamed protein product [Arabis nemorensis]|uniref:Reverse transcriptase zinc-binding domain-containing protein n=1 Tax=Arabis nemorensis TaxID=586526 RepID=A0A565C9L1_9BRAS|nr:unnamed protein product [Arabis nemorensis]
MVYKVSAQAITCGIFVQGGNISMTVTFVYGFNSVEERQSLWEELVFWNETTPVARHPWAIVGDFNQIIRITQHSNHQRELIDTSGVNDFNMAIQDSEVFEAQAKGLCYSWCNNNDENPISKKIDHAFINQHWASTFQDSYADFLEPQQSDHSPCLMCVPSLRLQVSKPFKFFHHVIDHPQYEEVVSAAWNCGSIQGTCQFKLMRSMKLLKHVLRRLNRRHYSGISKRVKAQAEKIAELQRSLLTNPSVNTARQEHQAREIWLTLIRAEEKFYRQKSRVQWMHLGDRNTPLFQRSVTQRASRNHIHFFKDDSGRKIVSNAEKKQHAAVYFQEVLGYTSLSTSPCSITQLQQLLPFRCLEVQIAALQKTVSEEEVKATVFALPFNKSPGPDGYSVEFLRASWNIVGGDVIAAVQEFFRNGRLLKDLNTTTIALIPKTPEACKLGEYRPISCCNLDMSGLDMNPAKSELFFGGYLAIQTEVLSGLSDIRIGAFPTRYLGLPLNPSKITFATLQPFLEKITNKLHSWTVKSLSFAGKVTLISSVIYGMVNFWSAVFVLPKRFYEKVDSLCSAFLWKNNTTSAVGARVAWDDICKPKAEGGLGIRLLAEFEVVFRVKQVWNFFANAGSLWVAWLQGNIFHRKSYWITEDSNRFSKTASFWFDAWTELGPLITYIGEEGPRKLQVRKDARVIESTRNGQWRMPGARSEEIQNFLMTLTTIAPPEVSRGRDIYLWRNATGTFTQTFSSKATWEQLRVHSVPVTWCKTVWFKQSVPKCAFVTWMAVQQRLPTRDRLRLWGMNVSSACVLCSNGIESHDHLFFGCSYSLEIWQDLASRIWQNPPLDLMAASTWILQPRQPTRSAATIIIKLILQSTIYLIWKERNSRIFTTTSTPSTSVKASIDRMICHGPIP